MTYQITYETKEELLQEVMEEIRDEYLKFVHKMAVSRRKEQGAAFHEPDFVAGASLIFFLLDANNDKFPAAWMLNMFRGESALFYTETENGKKEFENLPYSVEAHLIPLTEERPRYGNRHLFCSNEGGPVEWGRFTRYYEEEGIGLWEVDHEEEKREGTHWVKGFTNPWGNW